jgi:hypothetical protein
MMNEQVHVLPSTGSESEAYTKGCLIILQTRFWGATKKIDDDDLGDLPPAIVKASKDLLINTGKLEAVRGILGEAKRFIAKYAMDFPLPAVKFIGKNKIELVDAGLRSRKEYAEEAVEDLINSLEYEKAAYKAKYPEMYEESNYPTPAQLRENFKFTWKFRTIAPPGKELGVLSPEIYQQEVLRFRSEMKEFQDSLISLVASEFYTRIDKLKEQCLTGEISGSTLKSIHTVLEKFDDVWSGVISNDTITKMVDEVRLYLDGTDTGMLKADDEFREMVQESLQEVTNLIVNSDDPRIKRKIDIALPSDEQKAA